MDNSLRTEILPTTQAEAKHPRKHRHTSGINQTTLPRSVINQSAASNRRSKTPRLNSVINQAHGARGNHSTLHQPRSVINQSAASDDSATSPRLSSVINQALVASGSNSRQHQPGSVITQTPVAADDTSTLRRSSENSSLFSKCFSLASASMQKHCLSLSNTP